MLRQMDLMDSLSAQNATPDLASLRDPVAVPAYTMVRSREIWVGDERLDSQHEILFGLMRDLESAALVRHPGPILVDCFERLLLYMTVHFATEERLMTEGNYNDIESHRTEHETALNTIRRWETIFSQGQHDAACNAAQEVVNFLRSGVDGHIPGADAKLVRFLNMEEQ